MTLNTNAKLIIGLALTAGIGVAIAVILAPDKTNEFRKKINNSLDDFGQKVHQLLDEGKNNLAAKKRVSSPQA